MKQLLLLLSSLLAQAVAFSQITPSDRLSRPGLYMYNQLYLNPAYSGYQVRKEFGFSAVRASAAGGRQPLLGIGFYQAAIHERKSNLGMIISYEDQDNTYWRGKFGLVFSRSYNLGNATEVIIGTQLNAKYLNVNLTKYTAGVFANDDNDLRPDVDAGIWLKRNTFYLGVSGVSLLQPVYELQGNASRQDQRELFATTGYRFIFGRNMHITPSVLVNTPLASGSETHFDFSTQATLKILVIGATYRGQYHSQAPWFVQAGIQVNDKFQLIIGSDIVGSGHHDAQQSALEGNLSFRF